MRAIESTTFMKPIDVVSVLPTNTLPVKPYSRINISVKLEQIPVIKTNE